MEIPKEYKPIPLAQMIEEMGPQLGKLLFESLGLTSAEAIAAFSSQVVDLEVSLMGKIRHELKTYTTLSDLDRTQALFAIRKVVEESEAELKVTYELLAERQKVLEAIPECPDHGACIPHALEWIEKAKKWTP